MNKKNEGETQCTLAEAMSLRFVASLMAYSTFFSSLRSPHLCGNTSSTCSEQSVRAARLSRTNPRSTIINPQPQIRSQLGAITRSKGGIIHERKRKRPGVDRRTLDAAVEADALVAEAALPFAQLLPRRRPRCELDSPPAGGGRPL